MPEQGRPYADTEKIGESGGAPPRMTILHNSDCPTFGGVVRRSHRSGPAELLLSLVYVYPFRCQYCAHRFRAWRPGRRYARPAPERREYDRIRADIPVRLSGLPGSAPGRAIELSINGCTVDTYVMFATGAQGA